MSLSLRLLLVPALVLLLAFALCSCDPRFGPGDRPGNFAGCIVQTGADASLEDFRGRWVLVMPLEISMGYNEGRQPALSFSNFRAVSGKLDRERLTVLYVCNSEPCSRLQAAARRLRLKDPLLRTYEDAGWTDIERSYEYLIAPNGVVAAMERAGETRWETILPKFMAQKTDFSPLRLSQTSHWSADGSSMDLDFMLGGPVSPGTPCRLTMAFDFSRPEGESLPAVTKTMDFTIGDFKNSELSVPWHFDDLQGCNGANYTLSVLDPRLGVWINRHGVILAPDLLESGQEGLGGVEPAAASQGSANYDSQYRQPSEVGH